MNLFLIIHEQVNVLNYLDLKTIHIGHVRLHWWIQGAIKVVGMTVLKSQVGPGRNHGGGGGEKPPEVTEF